MARKSIKDKWIDDLLKQQMKEVKKQIHACAVETNSEMLSEVKNIYDSLIHDFYLYETSSYIRHHEGTFGTKQGQNLYFGKNFYTTSKHEPQLHIEFNGNMEGGYKIDSDPLDVLNSVMHGIRFPFSWNPTTKKHEDKPMMIENNLLSYKSKYFSYQGESIMDAFYKFAKEWDDISETCFYSHWEKYYNKLL